jgi:hypothetical protein
MNEVFRPVQTLPCTNERLITLTSNEPMHIQFVLMVALVNRFARLLAIHPSLPSANYSNLMKIVL